MKQIGQVKAAVKGTRLVEVVKLILSVLEERQEWLVEELNLVTTQGASNVIQALLR